LALALRARKVDFSFTDYRRGFGLRFLKLWGRLSMAGYPIGLRGVEYKWRNDT